jgi:hypothetical protein
MQKTKQTTVQTTEQGAFKTGELKPQAHGGALRHGGTNKGGGRLPNEYKQFLANSLDDELARKELQAVLRDSRHPAYGLVLGKAMLHVLGAPSRPEVAEPGDDLAIIIDL